MDEPIFLDIEDVIHIHQDQIAQHGGVAGILHMHLLESAVDMPRMQAFGVFMHATIFQMAAAYLFHLAKNHCFRDGNKRVAAAVAETFLEINGFTLEVGEPDYSDFVLRLAGGDATKEEAGAFYERYSRKSGA